MEYRKKYYPGYNLHLIKTDKFKMCHIDVIFRNNVNVNDLTKRQFLIRMLCENSYNYPSRRKLLLKLEDLYGASIYGNSSKVGSAYISNISIDYLNPQYTEKSMTKESIKLFFDIIFNPNVSVREFDSKTFNLIKERLRDSINSAIENPKRLSVLNAIGKLKDTPSAYSSLGTISSLEDITPENLYSYYEDMIKNDYVDIFVIGDINMDEVEKYISEYAKFKTIKNHEVNLYFKNKKVKEQNYTENFSAAQSNISIILNLNNLTDYEKKYVANLYNMILGGGALQTKLYKKLREENSLCYSVNSVYQKYDGLILITTGVDANSNDKAIKLIKSCIKDMAKNISDDEINDAKEFVITSLNYVKDDLGRIIDNYYFEDLHTLDDLETRIKTYKNVTKEDIYNVAKKISISVVYTLAGGNHEEN